MGYLEWFLLYLTIGAATFWPMLRLDREFRDYVLSGGKWAIAASWAIWSFAWLFSLVVDLMFWVVKEPGDVD